MSSRNHEKVEQILKELQNLHPENIDLGLGRTFELLEKLGNPQNNLPPVIHIAGTNGKGSTLSFIQGILESAGLVVHRYTSPELVKFNERYIISGKEISDGDLLKYLQQVKEVNNGTPITFFEITTAVCFKMFADNKADVILLETGLGGRLDSTNVVPNTAVNVITSIDMDHEAFLGDTVEKIATEKAGILRPLASVVLAPQNHLDVDAVVIGKANELGSHLNAYRLNWDYEVMDDKSFVLNTNKGSFNLPQPNLVGIHQYENASTAIVAVQELSRANIKVDPKHYAVGIQNAIHRGRFEKINISGITDKDIYMDGGHNPSASETILNNIKNLNVDKITLICGMLSGKDVAGFIEPLKPYINNAYTVTVKDNPFSTAPAMTADELATALNDNGVNANPCNDIKDAVKQAQQQSQSVILCAGSLHLVGDLISL
ncbi:MAG: bifunctional folylpolyglutamate synthase/dihydrofolate synthase [Alphaproteobacteria bacterium]